MQKRLLFVPSSIMSHVFLRFSLCLSFNSCDTHLLIFWKKQFVDYRPIVRRVVFVFANYLRSTMLAIPHLRIFDGIFVLLVCNLEITTFKMPKPSFTSISRRSTFTHKLFEVIDMIQQQFSPNENKNNAVLQCFLFGINFDTLNTTQHYVHTFPIYHSCVSHISWWLNKMAQCHIFIPQTVLVHNLLSEIRTSYLHTWYWLVIIFTLMIGYNNRSGLYVKFDQVTFISDILHLCSV